jgi:uncharacterized protein YqjF (DUF2071 family)
MEIAPMAGLSKRPPAEPGVGRVPRGDAASSAKPSEAPRPAFLTAQWRNLVVLNFDVDATLLLPFLPAGTELDFWNGRTFLSLVGFQFLDTRVLGVAIPFHRNFDEVNLRFYVRRKTAEGWRRAVVFIRELAPRRAVAWTARLLFGENYLTVPMRHHVELANDDPSALARVAYHWAQGGHDYELSLAISGHGRPAAHGSLEAFIVEHYWGCSGGPGRRTIEYGVEHPRWNLWPGHSARFDGDAVRLYGAPLAAPLSAPPASAFLADGSPVRLLAGVRLA